MNSGDELGGYDPTTPKPPQTQKPVPRLRQNSNRAVAGPSSKPTNTQAAKASSSKTNKDEAIILYSEDDEVDPPPPPARNKGKTAAAPALPNGKGTRGKGKGKDSTPQKEATDAMDIDDAPSTNNAPPPPRPKPRPTAKPPNKPHPQPRAKPSENDRVEALERENARLKKRLEDLSALHETTVKQVQESLQVRQTEPERMLQELTVQYEATLQAQEKLLEEQSKKLAHYGAAPQSGPSVQFLTREAVDEEKKSLEMKLKKLEDTIKDKDTKILELQQRERELEQQLTYESKLAEEYRTKNPPVTKANGGPRAAIQTSAGDPMHVEVIKFYEDLTNVLVTSVSVSPTLPFPHWPEFKVYTFMCTYTHVAEETLGTQAVNPSLQFGINSVWLRREATDIDDPIPPKSKQELQAKCHYWPLNLDKETPRFKERLDFFNESFLFSRDQMCIFIKTLGERLGATQSEGDTEDEVEAMISPRKR